MKETKAQDKTNVMRLLDAKKIAYRHYEYEGTADGAALSGDEVARVLGVNPDHVFKTLVTEAAGHRYYVFMVPVRRELNLKAAAKAVGEKKLEMLKAKELLPLTGYVHGGCSPIGMKKVFPTVADASAKEFGTIFFSAGKVGHQVEVAPGDLEKMIRISYAEIAE